MRRWFILITSLSFVFTIRTSVSAQVNRFEPSPHVFRIHSKCDVEPRQRVQTGFRVKRQKGIITALHGVLGCSTITAQPGGNGRSFANLKVVAVDISRDLALLRSDEMAQSDSGGLDEVPTFTTGELIVVGYPRLVASQRPTTVKAEYIEPLYNLLPEQVIPYLRRRSSPMLDLDVYSVEGHLAPGHSGAPLITRDWRVVAIGNGGLDVGRVEMAWAVPVHAIAWKPVTQAGIAAELKKLATMDFEFAFNVAVPEGYEPPEQILPPPQVWNDLSLNATYVKITKGEYQFGSTYVEANKGLQICYEYSGGLCGWEAFADEIVHQERRGTGVLPDFWIMETEVTNAQYDQCVRAGACSKLSASVRPSGPPDHPVRLGEVKHALDFARWACGRLPTELEWEKAARGPEAYLYPWGNEWDASHANSCGAECSKQPKTNIQLASDRYPETAPVYSFATGRSPYGLYHMAGNVREWVARDKNRPGISHDYMMKGGSFYDFPDVLRAADRLRSPIDSDGTVTAGFRIVRDRVGNYCG
ncbi:MAG: hypothetical protein DCC55_15855 [Chloroflexi bacterium]|nr:MAG: hypothetical protein DCC55_15855 [Chloroflexota bacterium]